MSRADLLRRQEYIGEYKMSDRRVKPGVTLNRIPSGASQENAPGDHSRQHKNRPAPANGRASPIFNGRQDPDPAEITHSGLIDQRERIDPISWYAVLFLVMYGMSLIADALVP